MKPARILLSRTDSIGDVVLTLPLAGWLKMNYPEAKIIFLCAPYTQSIVSQSQAVDEILVFNDHFPEQLVKLKPEACLHVLPDRQIAKMIKQAGIARRVGTSHRWYNWLYCNRLVNFSRKKSRSEERRVGK